MSFLIPENASDIPLPLDPSLAREVTAYATRRRRLANRVGEFSELAFKCHSGGETAQVVYFDYLHDASITGPHRTIFPGSLRDVSLPSVTLRCVLLEDLHPDKVDIVGAALRLDLRLFSTHLRDSEYFSSTGNSASNEIWSNYQHTRRHCSIKWLRPVIPSFAITERLRKKLISGEKARAPCVVRTCSVPRHGITTQNHIFRRSLDLSALPEDPRLFPVGWEERITVSKVVQPTAGQEDCHINPLPELQYDGGEHSVVTKSVVYAVAAHHDAEAQVPPRLTRRGTLVQRPTRGHPVASSAARTDHERTREAAQPTGPRLVKRVKKIELHNNFVPFVSVASRGNFDTGFEDVDELRDEFMDDENEDDRLSRPSSTLELITQSLSNHTTPATSDIAIIMIQIIHHDTHRFVEIVRAVLQDITRLSIDFRPVQLQEYAQHWRLLLSRFQYELRQIQKQLPEFRDFLFKSEEEFENLEVPSQVQLHVQQTTDTLREALSQIDSAYNALRAELQIADARKSIEEAENVARLTEIAFIFIPITLAASLFSMQIKELESPAPVGYFIATSLSLILLAYIVWLAVRNRHLKDYQVECLNMAREHAGLSEQEDITSRQFGVWMLATIGQAFGKVLMTVVVGNIRLIILLVVAVLLSVPLIFLWRKSINTGYTAMMTVLVVAVDLGILWIFGTIILSGWNPRDTYEAWVPPRKRRHRPTGMESEEDEENENNDARE